MTASNSGDNAEKLHGSYIANENLAWYSYSGNSLASSYKIMCNLQIVLRNCTLGHLSQRNENLCKSLYKNVHTTFIHNGQKLETAQLSFSR